MFPVWIIAISVKIGRLVSKCSKTFSFNYDPSCVSHCSLLLMATYLLNESNPFSRKQWMKVIALKLTSCFHNARPFGALSSKLPTAPILELSQRRSMSLPIFHVSIRSGWSAIFFVTDKTCFECQGLRRTRTMIFPCHRKGSVESGLPKSKPLALGTTFDFDKAKNGEACTSLFIDVRRNGEN